MVIIGLLCFGWNSGGVALPVVRIFRSNPALTCWAIELMSLRDWPVA